MKTGFALLIFCAGLAACGPSYTCGDFPEAVCQSVTNTYDQSRGTATQDSRAVDPSAPPEPLLLTTTNGVPLPHDVTFGDPFLSRPRLLRILLTPWEDKQKDLHAGGYVYIRLEESQWVIPR